MRNMMLLLAVLLVTLAATSYAVPIRAPEYGTVPPREFSPGRDVCPLVYYNFCSGWVWYWTGSH